MQIAVASGKGGTGKTTVAVNLAVSVSAPVQLLDCDVEAPNCHLFLRPELEPPQAVTTPIPKVDLEKCSYCRQCADFCQFRALAVFGDHLMVFPELCHGCGGCLQICPEGAIGETGRNIGEVQTGHWNGLDFGQGRLRVGEALAPPLIRAVRALAGSTGTTIIDAPPGTSCPVIAATRGVDLVILVTEPTPFGRHDLELAVDTFTALKLPQVLIINRAGIGRANDIREFARVAQIPILMEIPFDRQIAEITARGDLLVTQLPVYQERFRQLFRDIKHWGEHSSCKPC